MRGRKSDLVLPIDPLKSAAVAGLRYVTGDGPGIHRKRSGTGFTYIGTDSKRIRDKDEIERIKSLVIPPAWTGVWICPRANGHLQAVGRDAKGRKQYRYHPQYRSVRNDTKYSRMVGFGTALPAIRKCVQEHLKLPGLPKAKVLATVVQLLECTCIRIGNSEYVKCNNSYGLTTMRNRHVIVLGQTVKFRFRGKSGHEHRVDLDDPRLARIIKQCRDIPGFELFQYLDENGEHFPIESADVNDYLREIAGEDFTAKDFRTWNGTVIMAQELAEIGPCRTQTECKRNLAGAVKHVAKRLGNRPATCRSYYIHPAVTEAYADGTLCGVMNAEQAEDVAGLRRDELCVLALLKHYGAKPETLAHRSVA